jgi:hypothetical protein
MPFTRWFNPSQPQTLQIAVFLLYADAVFGVLFGALFFFPIGTALVLGSAAAALGIANDKRWGWVLGIVVSAIGLAFNLMFFQLIGLLFSIAQFALLVHPQSREYQKIWFR